MSALYHNNNDKLLQLSYYWYYIPLVELPLAGTPKDEYTIYADNVRCTGNESRLLECQHSTEHNCIHARDVFLTCRGSQLCIHGHT